MTTILRQWSYRYQWLYDSVTRLSALAVGGEQRFRQLALESLSIQSSSKVLDLCCGWGQATQRLVEHSQNVTGLDASARALDEARKNVPDATFFKGQAEALPFPDQTFDIVHTSAAMHEMESVQLQKVFTEVHRVLKPGGVFAMVDLHRPTSPLLVPMVALFVWLFETDTAWQLINTDLVVLLEGLGFLQSAHILHAGGSLQVIHAHKPKENPVSLLD